MDSLEVFETPCPQCGAGIFSFPYKPGTTHRLICPSCKKVIYIHVTMNGSVLTFTSEEYAEHKCKKCNGTGKCPDCKGAKIITCPDCKGKGYICEMDEAYEVYRQHYGYYRYYGCSLCGGSEYGISLEYILKGDGKITCRTCEGTGICPECGGEGVLP